MIRWEDRQLRLKAPREFPNSEAWYDYFVNYWIVNQPDADELMQLFIRCNFAPAAFVVCLKHGFDQDRLEIVLDELHAKDQ